MTMARRPDFTLLPCITFAASLKSEILPLVQEPITTWSTLTSLSWLTPLTLLGRCGQATCGSKSETSYSLTLAYRASSSLFKFSPYGFFLVSGFPGPLRFARAGWFLINFASMATTIHWLPYLSDALFIKLGSLTAAVLMETLSAPALSKLLMSDKSLTPPPTVRGIKTFSAVRLTTSKIIFLFSALAVISKNTSSSASSSSYLLETLTGSPASLSSKNFTPFTTRPSLTSRQGIILLVSIFCYFAAAMASGRENIFS